MTFRPLLVISMLLVVLSPSSARGQQCPTYSIDQPVWHADENPQVISAFLLHSINPMDQGNAKWLLIDAKNGTSIPIAPVKSRDYGPSSVTITPLQPLSPDGTYYLTAQMVKFDGCSTPQPQIAPTAVLTKRMMTPPAAYGPSTSRDDSDFYLAPTIDGATGTKMAYTLDTKFLFRKAILSARFGANSAYRPGVSLTPGVDLKISSNPKEDGDSVTFQAPMEVLTVVDPATFSGLSKLVPAVISRPAFVAEVDKKFHNVNGIFSDGEYLFLRSYGGQGIQFVPEPMIGVESGSNLKSQQAGVYSESILRATFGLRSLITVFQPSKAKPLFSIEGNYVRRLLLHPEPVYKQDTKGNLVLASVGTNPRDHVDVKVTYNVTPYVGLSLGYEYGQSPPVFTKVANKYTFGITFKGQLQYRPSNSAK